MWSMQRNWQGIATLRDGQLIALRREWTTVDEIALRLGIGSLDYIDLCRVKIKDPGLTLSVSFQARYRYWPIICRVT